MRNQVTILNGSLFKGLYLALAKFETENEMGKGTPTLQAKLKAKKKVRVWAGSRRYIYIYSSQENQWLSLGFQNEDSTYLIQQDHMDTEKFEFCNTTETVQDFSLFS